LLSQQPAKPHIAIVGIGNIFRSDDAAGILVAHKLIESRFISDPNTVLVIDAGHAPENRTAELRRFAPEVVLLIDAADIDERPGTIHWIEMDEIEGMSASTHTLPLSMLAKYLTLELNCRISLLGIQPKSNDVGKTVSADVQKAINTVVESLIEALL
jgi:hydrogenase 3 maturation protease